MVWRFRYGGPISVFYCQKYWFWEGPELLAQGKDMEKFGKGGVGLPNLCAGLWCRKLNRPLGVYGGLANQRVLGRSC